MEEKSEIQIKCDRGKNQNCLFLIYKKYPEGTTPKRIGKQQFQILQDGEVIKTLSAFLPHDGDKTCLGCLVYHETLHKYDPELIDRWFSSNLTIPAIIGTDNQGVIRHGGKEYKGSDRKEEDPKEFFEKRAPQGSEYRAARNSFNILVRCKKTVSVDLTRVLPNEEKDEIIENMFKGYPEFPGELKFLVHDCKTKLDLWKFALNTCPGINSIPSKCLKETSPDEISIWDLVYLAFHVTMRDPLTKEYPLTPITLIDVRKRSETLDDLAHQHPSLNSDVPPEIREEYKDIVEKWDNAVIMSGKQKGKKVNDVLSEYVGASAQGQKDLKISEKFSDFLYDLVDILSVQEKKYYLAHLWLKGYLGIELSPKQIEDRYLKKPSS